MKVKKKLIRGSVEKRKMKKGEVLGIVDMIERENGGEEKLKIGREGKIFKKRNGIVVKKEIRKVEKKIIKEERIQKEKEGVGDE